ncbi:MAG: DUF4381 domain-containing protein [Cellvibrionaceae bacterium]
MNDNDLLSQDPLSQLKDIQLPEPIGIWPPAPGWWILAIISLGLITFFIWKFLQQKKQQQYRKSAIALLNSEKTSLIQHKNVKTYLQNVSEILRRTALTAYPEQGVEPLQGEEWLVFLDEKINSKIIDKKHLSFVKGPARKIITLPYQDIRKTNITSKDIASIHKAILFWITFHTNKPTNNQTIQGIRYA